MRDETLRDIDIVQRLYCRVKAKPRGEDERVWRLAIADWMREVEAEYYIEASREVRTGKDWNIGFQQSRIGRKYDNTNALGYIKDIEVISCMCDEHRNAPYADDEDFKDGDQ